MPILHAQMAVQAQQPDGSFVQLPPNIGLIQRGPCLQVAVTIAKPMGAQLLQAGHPVPTPEAGLALIDTGATRTCVDNGLAARLGLPVIDVARMTSATEADRECNVYPVNIEIVGAGINIDVGGAMGAELAAQGILVLIGRDALSSCTLHYNGPSGQFTLAL
jgi:predicted aspartyl protease